MPQPIAQHLRLVFIVSAIAALGLVTVSCGDDEGGDGGGNNANNAANNVNNSTNNATNNSTNNTTEPAAASFVTWNVGLPRGFVPYASDRVGPVAEALSGLDADVVCLQEVWLVEDEAGEWTQVDIEAIQASTAATYPHTYVHVTRAEGEAASCTEEEVMPLEACVVAACDGVDPDNLSGCVLDNCRDEFFATSGGCQACAASQLGNPLEEIISACTSGQGDAFAYGGHNGLMLLSRHPIAAMNNVEFESALTYRSALHARVAVPDSGEYDVYCTHIAADLSESITYPGMVYASFEEENAAQIDGLLAFIADSATTGHVVLMGDFNTGPGLGENLGELEANFPKFAAGGLHAPYLEQDDPLCTFCPSENTLDGGEGARIIDHIFLSFDPSMVEVHRIMDQTRSIDTVDGPMELHLSDHFGLEMTLTP